MQLRLNDIFPEFIDAGDTTSFYQWIGGHWFVLIININEKDEELIDLLSDEFTARDLKSLILTWLNEEDKYYYHDSYEALSPIIVRKIWNSLSVKSLSDSTQIIIVDPRKNIRSILTYNPFSERNLDEIFNVFDTIRLCESQFPGHTEEQLIAPEERELKSRRFFIDSLLLPLN